MTTIKLQESTLDLINPISPKEIKVIKNLAIVYSSSDDTLTEIGNVSSHSIFTVIESFPLRIKEKFYWVIEYQGNRALIESTDAEPFR